MLLESDNLENYYAENVLIISIVLGVCVWNKPLKAALVAEWCLKQRGRDAKIVLLTLLTCTQSHRSGQPPRRQHPTHEDGRRKVPLLVRKKVKMDHLRHHINKHLKKKCYYYSHICDLSFCIFSEYFATHPYSNAPGPQSANSSEVSYPLSI